MMPRFHQANAVPRNEDKFVEVLGKIARGRADCGRPLAAETARQMAREVLDACGMQWPPHVPKAKNA